MAEVIELTPEEIQDVLDTQMCGTLGLVDGNKPYQSPVCFLPMKITSTLLFGERQQAER